MASSINKSSDSVKAAAAERAAANAANTAAANASTAGQGSAGIDDGDKAKAATKSAPKGL